MKYKFKYFNQLIVIICKIKFEYINYILNIFQYNDNQTRINLKKNEPHPIDHNLIQIIC